MSYNPLLKENRKNVLLNLLSATIWYSFVYIARTLLKAIKDYTMPSYIAHIGFVVIILILNIWLGLFLNKRTNKKKRLENVRERILLFISKHPEFEDKEISKTLSIGTEVVKTHLEELRKSKFVKVAHIQGSDWENIPYREEWSTDHLGRKYLMHHKLIQQ